jgi:alginate O-acetyltransferase complex protein AlgI
MLVASYMFYMWWNPAYILLILMSTAVDYFCARAMSGSEEEKKRRRYLLVSIVFNLGLLLCFKYFNFFASNVNELLEWIGSSKRISESPFLLPIGISFYTFQTLSYSIDVYRRNLEAERHFGRFALYVSFFPQLVAGPIERATRLLPELKKESRFDPQRIAEGLQLILWGLFKKMVIADRLAVYVNRIYGEIDGSNGATLVIATYFFAFQIYCDFSGYSDIAIGTARIFGIRLMQNFRLPYLAKGISEFWSRWHISLTTWFRDYVYIPLGGNRVGTVRWIANVFIIFVISGLWHGANWTFVAWGMLHAAFFGIERLVRNFWKIDFGNSRLRSAANLVNMVLTFHLVVFAWIFFRAQTLQEAFDVVTKIISEPFGQVSMGASTMEFALSVFLVLSLLSIQILQSCGVAPFYQTPGRLRPAWNWLATWILALAIIVLGKTSSDFLYFQF